MMRIVALNEESEDDSNSEEEVTRDALEEIALQEYAKAIELQRKGSLKEALKLLQDLLDTDLLDVVKKPEPGKQPNQLYNMKYLCHKNIASILNQLDKKEEAIEAYFEACILDGTDVTLWNRLGNICLQCEKFELALQAFQRGVDCNPRHWPCLDKIITLLFGLSQFNECIMTIYETLDLDSDYLRALVYRKFIYTNYPHIKDYLCLINPIYNWKLKDDPHFDEEVGEKLLEEAKCIKEKFADQIKNNSFVPINPELLLKKPISDLTWLSVGESLVHMHNYMTENLISHACVLEISFLKKTVEEKMESEVPSPSGSSEPLQKGECNPELERNEMSTSECEMNEQSDKNMTDNEKAESDADNAQQDCQKSGNEEKEGKETKKAPVRRRGSALSFLQQWEWCTKRRSSRKKPNNIQDREDETVFDTLRRLLPSSFMPNNIKKNIIKSDINETSFDTLDLYKLFEEKEKDSVGSAPQKLEVNKDIIYFGSTDETNNVQDYINKYMESKCDIITLLRDYLQILASKWKEEWPVKLPETFVQANNCLNNHIDRPCCFNGDFEELKFYGDINMCALEVELETKCHSKAESKEYMNTEVVDLLGFYLGRPQIYGQESLIFTLRYLWIKAHAALYNERVETALDALYQLLQEFNALGEEYEDLFFVKIPNFTFKPQVSKDEVKEILKCLERNMLLSTVMELYEKDNLEQALTILIDSFKACQELAHKQQYDEISLDWAVQLSLLIDVHWALGKVRDCFTWATTSLQESLKHYLLCTQGSCDYDKWTLAIIKALLCIEHIIKQEGIYFLDVLKESQLNRLVQSLVEIIGHQCNENSLTDMPINTVTPWIILHYVLQREEDQGRIQKVPTSEENEVDELDNVPSSILILFQAHEYLGRKSWCCHGEGYLLHFILDNLIPRLHSPILAPSLETITQYLEQCVFCLFGHPSKKTKLRYLTDHNVDPYRLDWQKAQQIYEIFKPSILPELDSHKAASISAETEQLLLRILSLLPQEYNPKSHKEEILSYIDGKTDTLPIMSNQMPYKIRDIYYLLADYYFKNKEYQKFLKYNIYDIIVNKNRFDSWAAMGLTRGSFLETKLNSCDTIKSDMDYLTKAAVVERCFKKSLEIDSTHATLWIEYGCFVYYVHSFCSRLLKQASESLSMDDFEALEQRKESMLDTADKCFNAANKESYGFEYEDQSNDERWLHYYMLGKIAEKKREAPGVYLNFYIEAAKYLQQNKATYPSKINYNAPQNLSIEALEIHYRMNASILKYIEQHESKAINALESKAFQDCLSYCMSGPFSRNKSKRENADSDTISKEDHHNMLKRSISDAGDDGHSNKKVKLEDCVTLRRSISYDADTKNNTNIADTENKDSTKVESVKNIDLSQTLQKNKNCQDVKLSAYTENNVTVNIVSSNTGQMSESSDPTKKQKVAEGSDIKKTKLGNTNISSPSHDSASTHTNTTQDTTSDSSSNTSSDDSSSESSSDTSDTSCSKASTVKTPKCISQADIDTIIATCLDNLEDCVSRLPQHYKALYRLAHYHFYYKRGKDIERCRDLMLASFTSRNGQKLQGLFSERKNSNFFNGIWRIPVSDIDRAGSFASHMSRCVLLSMDILKEIDDHKTLLDLSLQLHRVPDPDKKYLRDSEREELSQQALSLCVQSLKGQLTKFSQQSDLKSNEVERKALSSLMLDIFRAHQKALKHTSAKQFGNLLTEGYKLSINTSLPESTNLLDVSLKYCQNLVSGLKQQATMNVQGHTSSAMYQLSKKTVSKIMPDVSGKPITIPASSFLPQVDHKSSMNLKISSLPTSDAITNSLLNSYLPMLADHSLFSQTSAAAAALSYMSNLGNYSNYQSIQNSYQKEFSRQYMSSLYGTNYIQNIPQQVKSKQSATKVSKNTSQVNKQGFGSSASTSGTSARSQLSKNKSPQQTTQSSVLSPTSEILTHMNPLLSASIASVSLATSNTATFGTTVQPAHMASSNIPTFTSITGAVKPAHLSTTSTMSAALQTKPPPQHQQVSPGKTLQEKLAERQKHNPSIPKMQSLNEVNSSLTSKLPSTLTITKTVSSSLNKKDKSASADKRPPDVRRAVQEKLAKPKTPISSSEVIVLDDDDD